MSEATETIGVDLGGTKVQVGVLAGVETLWESREGSREQSQDELVELIVREIEAAREARPHAAAVGLGIPATINQARGEAIAAVNLPLVELPIRDLISERVGLPVFLDNDGNVAALAEHLYGAARGKPTMVMLTIGTGIGGGLILEGRIFRGATGAGAELGHVVIQADGPPCQGNCPNHGCVESLASGTALGREGRAAAESAPDSAIGRLLAEGVAVDGLAVTEAALAGDETSIGVFDLIGSRLGVACASFANVFEPEAIVIGGGVIAAGDLLLDPCRKEVRERALRPMNETPILEATLGNDAGMIGAAALARTELEQQGLMAGALVVCPTPIGNLDDVTPRIREALISADFIACEDTRRTGKLLELLAIRPAPRLISNHEGNEQARSVELSQQIERGYTVALVSDAGMPGISDPGFKLIRRCIDRDLEVTVLPGPSVVLVALVASGLPTDRWRFEGFLPRRAGEMERVLRSTETMIAFESPRRVGESLAALAAIAPDREAAVCRELTKVHEEVARGTLGELARHFRGDVKGEIVLVIGPSATAEHGQEIGFAVDALRHLVQSGARPRAAASVVAALTGTRANDLYKALTGREARR